jgi:hypothetical protein
MRTDVFVHRPNRMHSFIERMLSDRRRQSRRSMARDCSEDCRPSVRFCGRSEAEWKSLSRDSRAPREIAVVPNVRHLPTARAEISALVPERCYAE